MKIIIVFNLILISLLSLAQGADWVISPEYSVSSYSLFYKGNKNDLIVEHFSNGDVYKKYRNNILNSRSNLALSSYRSIMENIDDEYIVFLNNQNYFSGIYFVNIKNKIERVDLDDLSSSAVFDTENLIFTNLKIIDIRYNSKWHRLIVASGDNELAVYEIIDGEIHLQWKMNLRLNIDKVEVVRLETGEWNLVTLQDNKLIFYAVTTGEEFVSMVFTDTVKLKSIVYSSNTEQYTDNLYVSTSNNDIWRIDLVKMQIEKNIYKAGASTEKLHLISVSNHITGQGNIVVMAREDISGNILLLGVWDRPFSLAGPIIDNDLQKVSEIINVENYVVNEQNYMIYSQPINERVDWERYFGWFLSLNTLSVQVVTEAKLVGRVLLVKLASSEDSKMTKLVILDPQTGGAPEFVVLDLNEDGIFSTKDKVNDQSIIAIETNTPSIVLSPDARLHGVSSSPIKIQVDPRHNKRHTWYVMPPELVP